jgi:hypothetical protein
MMVVFQEVCKVVHASDDQTCARTHLCRIQLLLQLGRLSCRLTRRFQLGQLTQISVNLDAYDMYCNTDLYGLHVFISTRTNAVIHKHLNMTP